jgi:hypothetical protein
MISNDCCQVGLIKNLFMQKPSLRSAKLAGKDLSLVQGPAKWWNFTAIYEKSEEFKMLNSKSYNFKPVL